MVTAFLTVGFSHARYASGNRTSQVWRAVPLYRIDQRVTTVTTLVTVGFSLYDAGGDPSHIKAGSHRSANF